MHIFKSSSHTVWSAGPIVVYTLQADIAVVVELGALRMDAPAHEARQIEPSPAPTAVRARVSDAVGIRQRWVYAVIVLEEVAWDAARTVPS